MRVVFSPHFKEHWPQRPMSLMCHHSWSLMTKADTGFVSNETLMLADLPWTQTALISLLVSSSVWLWPGPVGLLLQEPGVHLHPGLPAALWHPLRQLPGLHHRRGHLRPGPHLPPQVLRVQLVQVSGWAAEAGSSAEPPGKEETVFPRQFWGFLGFRLDTWVSRISGAEGSDSPVVFKPFNS